MSSPILQALQGRLVVSCQAPAESPLSDPAVIAAMAEAAILRGAVGVRIDTPAHCQAVRSRVSAPMIGLWKQLSPGFEVYITPQFVQAAAIAAAGADLIAVDATLRPRPGGETLPKLIEQIHAQLGKPVIADIDTLEAAIAAEAAGADCVSTTLYGYTAQTGDYRPPDLNFVAQLGDKLQVPVICEGGITSPAIATAALNRGAYTVVVGTDITGIDLKVKAYVEALP